MALQAGVAICFTTSMSSFANLITNGSFEDNAVNTNSWSWFTATNVNGWEGSNIEIWDSFQNFDAFDGVQLAELNSHGQNGQAFSIFQTFDTTIGDNYYMSFAYSARANTNEAFSVELSANNTEFFSQEVNDHVVKRWSVFTASFQAVSDKTTIRFNSITPHSGTVGNFLDDVVVIKNDNLITSSTSVSAPSGVLMLGMALVGLAASRKKFL